MGTLPVSTLPVSTPPVSTPPVSTSGPPPPEPVTIGVDVGGTKILAVALDGEARVLDEARRPTPLAFPGAPAAPGLHPAPVVDVVVAIAEAVAELRAATTGLGRGLAGIGLGLPGLIGADGDLRFAPNLLQGQGRALGRELSPLVDGVAVTTENDATCATVAESTIGAAVGTDDAVIITLGTGIGGGLVVGGRVARGTNGFAGDAGHMVIDPDGPVCPCGRHGCWERYASGSGLSRLAHDAARAGRLPDVVRAAGGHADLVRAEHVTAAAATGSEPALAVLVELAGWLALGLANLAVVLDPSRFVLGGGLIEAAPMLIEPTRTSFHSFLERRDRRPAVRIVAAALGERAGAVGAAMLARP